MEAIALSEYGVRDKQCYLKLSNWGDFQVVSGKTRMQFYMGVGGGGVLPSNRVAGFHLGFIIWHAPPEIFWK